MANLIYVDFLVHSKTFHGVIVMQVFACLQWIDLLTVPTLGWLFDVNGRLRN